MSDDDSDKYKVGYKSPPREHQFKKGATKPEGSGRRKGVKAPHIIIDQILKELRQATVRGKVMTMPTIELFIRSATDQALHGTIRDKITYLWVLEKLSPGSIDQTPLLVESMQGDGDL